MSSVHAMQTIFELALAILLLYGFYNESNAIAFEQGIKRIILGNYRRFIRTHKQRKEVRQ